MTGPEHYREAERLLTEAAAVQVHEDDAAGDGYLARAWVHAQLATAAAVALAIRGADTVAWEATAGPPKKPLPPVTVA